MDTKIVDITKGVLLLVDLNVELTDDDTHFIYDNSADNIDQEGRYIMPVYEDLRSYSMMYDCSPQFRECLLYALDQARTENARYLVIGWED